MPKMMPASLVLALAAPFALPPSARADTPNDLQTLRQELAAMRADYEARLQALERRLQAAQAQAAPVATTPSSPTAITAAINAPITTPEPASVPPSAPMQAAANAPTAGGGNAFNPAMSLILSGLYTRTSRDPARYAISGFPLTEGAEVGPGTRGFSLAESELGFAANVDPWTRGVANIALHGDDSVSVEEAYVQTTAMGNGLSLKAGRFFSGVGYLNAKHSHTWDFVDNPLAYQAMLGTQYGDDGVQLTWLAPTDQFIELGLELGRGRGFPGGDNSRNGAGMSALTAHTGGDIGASQSWRAGLSVLNARADEQTLTGLDTVAASTPPITSAFTGRTRVWVADAVWKWAPNGNATRTSFTLQGEYLRAQRSGRLVYDVGGAASDGAFQGTSSGWYVQGVYQFMPRWRVGLRTERLDPGTPDFGANTGLYALNGHRPSKQSVMLDFSASEFSRVRLQLAQDRSQPGAADRQVQLQYQMSLGAHGAHGF